MSVKLPEFVANLASKALNEIKVDGNQLTLDEQFYFDNLPEGITKEHVEKVHNYDADFFAASGHAFGMKSIELMKADKNLEQTSFTTAVVKDTIKGTMNREWEKMTGAPKEGEPVEKVKAYGQLTMGWHKKGTKGSQGAMKKVRDDIGHWATEAFGE